MNIYAIEKLKQLKAVLLAVTGSQGADELGDEINPFLDACVALAQDALQLAEAKGDAT